jgi:FkbM family methyltransferase
MRCAPPSSLPSIVVTPVHPDIRKLLPRSIRPHRILAGPLRGYRVVTSWHDYPAAIAGRTERPLLDWFQLHVKPGSTWLDVGGHYGYTAIALSRLVGPSGRVFAFEPVVATAGCIAAARELNSFSQLTVVPQGLGSPATVELMKLPSTRGMADRTLTSGTPHWAETIQVVRFDWLWPLINLGDGRIDGIKIDVQGMELEVLAGMLETLRKSDALLVIEFHRGVSRRSALDLLFNAGYTAPGVAVDKSTAEDGDLADDCSYAFVKCASC